MRKVSAIFLGLLLAVGGFGREDKVVCGTHHENWKEEIALHRQAVRARKLRTAGRNQALAAVSATKDVGHIVVMEESDGVVSRRNEFNLDGKTISFAPGDAAASRYRFQTSDGGYDNAAAASGTLLALNDDDTRKFTLNFDFPFFGSSYRELYINSDGNITLTAGDTSISERSLGRMTSGTPRIAALYRDLDPTRARTGIRVLSDAGRLVVSWVEVPEFSDFGTGPLQTFQIRLLASGRIEMSHNGVTTKEAIVGITPGRLRGPSSVVSFVTGSGEEFTSTIAERFTGIEQVDTVAAAQKFYESHEDAYDYLVFYNNMGVAAGSSAVAYEVTVRNNRSGYGDLPVDNGAIYGSRKRLQAVINMGHLQQYPVDPNGLVRARLLSGDTPLTILAHEAGHLFLAFASVRDPHNPNARPMLGFQTAHWNFYFNSEASLLEGNRIRDDGPNATGKRFTTVATVEAFSPLDQYLMGFRAPDDFEVPPTFLVQNPDNGGGNRQPQAGVSFNGERRDIRVQEIVEAEGRRTPDHTVSQRRFRFAFVLIAPKGIDPPAEQIQQVETYRREFESFYHRATSERAAADAGLRRSLAVSLFPAAGVTAGATIQAAVETQRPVESPLTVLLSAPQGGIETPSSVTIPAGETRATFSLAGVRAGVAEFEARPSDDRYDTAYARVQVTNSTAALRVELVSGGSQVAVPGAALPEPVRVRVADINNLPYPGLRVRASVSEGGSVQPDAAETDENGIAAFRWTPGANPLNELTATIGGGTAAVVTALSRPFTTQAAVVNAATFLSGIAPNSLGTIFGANLAGGADLQSNGAGVRVLLNDRPVPISFVSERQINFLVPPDIAEGPARLAVSTPVGVSTPVEVPVTRFSPGIFFNTATRVGAVLTAGTGRLTTELPARRGEFIEVYATGLGPVRFSSVTHLDETVERPEALVASIPAEVVYSGMAPGFPGLYQLNVRIPGGAPGGLQPLSLTVGGHASNQVLIGIE